METTNDKRKWSIVAGGFIFFFMTMGLYSNCFSLYIIPITEDLGFTRGQFSIAQTMIFASGIVCSLTAPKLFKSFGIINVIKVAAVLGSVSYFIESMATQLWQFYVLSFIEGFCMGLTCSMPMAILLAEWFKENTNTAVGITAVGSGIGGSILNIIVNSIITNAGWRASFRIMGIAALVVNCIPAFVLLKRNPEALEKEKAAREAAALSGDDGGRAKKSSTPVDPRAMRFGIFSMFISFCGCIIMYVAVPHLRDLGYSSSFTALVSSGSMIALAAGKFVYGILLDRIGIKRCFRMSQIISALGMLTLIFFRNPLMLVPLYIADALSCSYGSVGVPAASTYFAVGDNRSETLGIIMAMGSVGGALSTTVAGFVFDAAGSYVPVFAVCAVLVLIMIPLAQKMFYKG